MQYQIGKQDWRLGTIVTLAATFGVIIAANRYLILSFPVLDPFHNGEFVAAAMAVLHNAPFKGDPFTMHGAADIFPALAANLFGSGPEHLIAYTLVIYPFLALLSVILTMLAALQIAVRLGGNQLLIVPFLVLVPFAVGWRDLFFVLSLSIFTELVCRKEDQRGSVAIQIIFGVVIAAGTYWSFNRGVAALLAFGPVTLWLTLQDHRFLISISTALVSFVFIGSSLPGISVVGYAENLLMLFETSSQWEYLPSLSGYAKSAALLTGVVASSAAALVALRKRGSERHRIALTFALLTSSAVYAKIGLGRIDSYHIIMAAWLPLLITSVSLRWDPTPLPQGWARRPILLSLTVLASTTLFYFAHDKHAVLMLLATFLIILGASISAKGRFGVGTALAVLVVSSAASAPLVGLNNFVRGDFDWLVSLNALPSNDIAVTREVLWTAESIDKSGAACVFDLANTGLVNAVAGLPSCSRFTYPVYADADFENRLISDLIAADPPVIVYRSDYWSYSIDGRPMSERFPAVNALVQQLYPREDCNLGVCLRYKD